MKLFCVSLWLGILLPTILCQEASTNIASTITAASTTAASTTATSTTATSTTATSTTATSTTAASTTAAATTDASTTVASQQTEKTTADATKEATAVLTEEPPPPTVEDEFTEPETTTKSEEESGFSWATWATEAITGLTGLADKLSTEDLADQVGDLFKKVVDSLPVKSANKEQNEDEANINRVDQATSILNNLPSIPEVLEKWNSVENVVNTVESNLNSLIDFLPDSLVKPVKDFINATIDEPFKAGFLDPVKLVTTQVDGVKNAIDRVNNTLWWFNRGAIALVISSVIVFAFKVNIGYDIVGWLVSNLFGLVTQIKYDSVGWLLGETGIVKQRRDELYQFYNPQRSISRTAPILKSISDFHTKYEDNSGSHTPFPYSDYTD